MHINIKRLFGNNLNFTVTFFIYKRFALKHNINNCLELFHYNNHHIFIKIGSV
jgi:hypothetical protein